MTDWTHLLGWGSPVGLGAFFVGVGTLLRVLAHGMHHMEKPKK